MSEATLKIQCKATDLISNMEKHLGVENIVIETDDDVKGIINCLFETLYVGTEDRCSGAVRVKSCRLEGEMVIVEYSKTG